MEPEIIETSSEILQVFLASLGTCDPNVKSGEWDSNSQRHNVSTYILSIPAHLWPTSGYYSCTRRESNSQRHTVSTGFLKSSAHRWPTDAYVYSWWGSNPQRHNVSTLILNQSAHQMAYSCIFVAHERIELSFTAWETVVLTDRRMRYIVVVGTEFESVFIAERLSSWSN